MEQIQPGIYHISHISRANNDRYEPLKYFIVYEPEATKEGKIYSYQEAILKEEKYVPIGRRYEVVRENLNIPFTAEQICFFDGCLGQLEYVSSLEDLVSDESSKSILIQKNMLGNQGQDAYLN